MITRFLPVLVLCACSTAAPLTTTEQPALVQVVAPYARALREVGVTRVLAQRGSALIRLDTRSGPVYITYPSNASRPEFVVDVNADTVRASALSFERDRDSAMVAAILSDAISKAEKNNAVQWIRANPWH
jgi:hypothetical protein